MSKNSIIENMLQGVRDNFSILDQSSYRLPAKGGFEEDFRAMKGDADRLAEDMTKVVKTHEQDNRRQG
jgi:hypothetical protein